MTTPTGFRFTVEATARQHQDPILVHETVPLPGGFPFQHGGLFQHGGSITVITHGPVECPGGTPGGPPVFHPPGEYGTGVVHPDTIGVHIH